MINCPLASTLKKSWYGHYYRLPVVTQVFGNELVVAGKPVYAQWNMKGHNGIDLRCRWGEPGFMPASGIIRVYDEGDIGYGLNVRIFIGDAEIVCGHLSKVFYKDKDYVKLGSKLFLAGNSGHCLPKPTPGNPHAGTHLHLGYRRIDRKTKKVLDYNNGFKGYIDIGRYIFTLPYTTLFPNEEYPYE